MSAVSRLEGHGLEREGIHPGPAVCGCGAQSGPLPSQEQRQAWHREHKAAVAGPDWKQHVPHVVYRAYMHDVLLYVGVTHDLRRRLNQHRSSPAQPWLLLTTRITVEEFPDFPSGRAGEKAAIRAELPLFNHETRRAVGCVPVIEPHVARALEAVPA